MPKMRLEMFPVAEIFQALFILTLLTQPTAANVPRVKSAATFDFEVLEGCGRVQLAAELCVRKDGSVLTS